MTRVAIISVPVILILLVSFSIAQKNMLDDKYRPISYSQNGSQYILKYKDREIRVAINNNKIKEYSIPILFGYTKHLEVEEISDNHSKRHITLEKNGEIRYIWIGEFQGKEQIGGKMVNSGAFFVRSLTWLTGKGWGLDLMQEIMDEFVLSN